MLIILRIKWLHLLLGIIYCLWLCLPSICCSQFSQTHFGVNFQPWVKQFEDGEEIPSFKSYTMENMKTMIDVVSGKFSKLFVDSTFAFHDTYGSFTYYKGSYAIVLSGELAAEINKRKGDKHVSLLYNVMLPVSNKEMEAGILVALEAAEKANHIYPGTVEGISFCETDKSANLQVTLHNLKIRRARASKLGLKLGACLKCYKFFDQRYTLSDIQREIIADADFIVCSIAPNNSSEPVSAFQSIAENLLAYRNFVSNINANAEVKVLTKCPCTGSCEQKTIENRRVFWETANAWAISNNYTIFVQEAFDNPWRKKIKGGDFGWWKLTNNSMINKIDGYVEKTEEYFGGKMCPAVSSTDAAGNEIVMTSNETADNGSDNDEPASVWNEANISLAAIGACIIIILIAIGIRCHVRKPPGLKANEIKDFLFGTSSNVEESSFTPLERAMQLPYSNSLEISKENLKIYNNAVLGSGQFGFVYKALLESNGEATQVAVKVAKNNHHHRNYITALLSEIKIMTYIGAHPNIVALKGACTAELSSGILYLVTELCGLGSLQNFLRNAECIGENSNVEDIEIVVGNSAQEMELVTKPHISLLDMLRWSHGIALGMEYLERKHVVHADLASRNVLLSAEKTAKIADFGLSRRMYNFTNYMKKKTEPLPWRWMAIESLRRLEFSSKSDVWAYGVTLWEIFSKGDIPYPGLSWTQYFTEELVNGLRLNCPQLSPSEIYSLMWDCWKLESGNRPGFGEIARRVEVLLQNHYRDRLKST